MAIGKSKPAQATGQVVLMLESELARVYPWLEEDLVNRPGK